MTDASRQAVDRRFPRRPEGRGLAAFPRIASVTRRSRGLLESGPATYDSPSTCRLGKGVVETPRSEQGTQAGVPLESLAASLAGLVTVVEKGLMEETLPFNLSPLEFNLLRTCMLGGEHTATRLAEMLPVDASRISRVVTRLVDMGLLRRRRLRSDRRVVMLRLTERGTELTSLIEERVQVYDARLVEGVSSDEMRGFTSTVSKILANYAALKPSR